MKTLYNLSLILLSFALTVSCGTNDDTPELTGHGTVKIEFDNSIATNDLILGTPNQPNAQGETLTISHLNYTVSNFKLTDNKGNVFIYPKNESYFTISEEARQTEVILTNVPAGRYTALTFGIGVNQEKYQQGAEEQGELLTQTENTSIISPFQEAHTFLNFEGTFTSATSTEPIGFKIRIDSDGADSNTYKEIHLEDFNGDQALVSDTMSPIIHLIVDADRILDEIPLTELEDGTGDVTITTRHEKAAEIVENTAIMFQADHVHNGNGHDH